MAKQLHVVDLVLGVDPGTRLCGWGLVDRSARSPVFVAAGVIDAGESRPIAERLRAVFEGLRAVIAEHEPSLVAVEEAYYGKNVRSAIRLGEGRGVALLAAALADVPVVELQASLVKKAVTGHGGATKEQVRSALEATLAGGVREKVAALPMDATDAVGLALGAGVRGAIAGAGSESPPGPFARRRGKRGRVRWTEEDVKRLGLDPEG